jgi:hypothetical protein
VRGKKMEDDEKEETEELKVCMNDQLSDEDEKLLKNSE